MVCPTCNFLTPDTTINENEPIGTFVGKLLTDDQCKGSCLAVHNYELVPGDGDDDNSSFSFKGFYLQSSTVFDYETKNSYSIRIKSTSSNGGYSYEKKFTILINDVPDQITDLQLSNNSIVENRPKGTIIGEFSSKISLIQVIQINIV